MKISELQPRQGKVELEGTISALQAPKDISKPGFNGKVQEATLTDDSGSVTISLWNEDVEKYQEGDKVRVSNGWVNEFQGKLQLSAGRFGKLEKI